jgi:PPOX class probable F420-dependent enzyme
MTVVTEGARNFLKDGPHGHMVTLNPDGTPHVTLVWAGFEGDELVFASFFDQHKLDCLRRDPRVTVSFQANEHEGEGLHPYMVVRGTARVSEGGALPVMDQLSETYIGPGAVFPMRDVPPGFVIHVDIERIYGVGLWRDQED